MSRAEPSARDAAVRRIEALVQAARAVAAPTSELGRRARAALVASTGLSAEGVELGLTECLETSPPADEIAALVDGVAPAPHVHVILPANVFVAAHRAVALALAASPHVFVRPSRREPHLARLLAEAAPGLFALTDTIRAAPGDHVWAYGGENSLGAILAALAEGVELHARGPGYGVAVVDAPRATAEAATALAADIVPFDQRGCLSPRLVLLAGTARDAERFAELVARALAEAARRVPLGGLDDAELADARAFRDARSYAGSVFPAGPGVVATGTVETWAIAPAGRNLVVAACPDPLAQLAARSEDVTAVGIRAANALAEAIARALPSVRVGPLGCMQRPPFDGPADRRP